MFAIRALSGSKTASRSLSRADKTALFLRVRISVIRFFLQKTVGVFFFYYALLSRIVPPKAYEYAREYMNKDK